MLQWAVIVVAFLDKAGTRRRAAVEGILEDAGLQIYGGDWVSEAAAVSPAEVRA
jgi:hypothetical protein